MREHAESIPLIPTIIPAYWEDYPVFRETGLCYVTDPATNAALRVLARTWYDLVLEYYHHWPHWPESATRMEVRAALADVRHLEGFLASVGRERADAVLTPHDTALSQLASTQAGELARIAAALDAALAQE